MIIDIHAHTSNSKLYGLYVDSATISDLERYADQFGIEKTILMATYFTFKGTGVYNYDIMQRVNGNPRFIIFGSLNAMGDLRQGIAELQQLAEAGSIGGIKLYAGYQDFNFSSDEVDDIYYIAQEYGLPVAIHTGELHHCCPMDASGQKRQLKCGLSECAIDRLGYLAHPHTLAPAVRKFPYVKFIFCHMSNPFFAELRQVMAECGNLYTDISGQFLSGSHESTPEYKKYIVEELAKFIDLPSGIDRVLFGTDFPIQSHEDTIELVTALDLSKPDQEKIFYSNAVEVLGL